MGRSERDSGSRNGSRRGPCQCGKPSASRRQPPVLGVHRAAFCGRISANAAKREARSNDAGWRQLADEIERRRRSERCAAAFKFWLRASGHSIEANPYELRNSRAHSSGALDAVNLRRCPARCKRAQSCRPQDQAKSPMKVGSAARRTVGGAFFVLIAAASFLRVSAVWALDPCGQIRPLRSRPRLPPAKCRRYRSLTNSATLPLATHSLCSP